MNFESSTKMAQPNEKASSSFPLTRQPSIFSMTFDELQMTGGLGKDFGSMNMEDLLKNIWTAEEAEGNNGVAGIIGNASLGGNLQKQGSLTLPRTLGVRTVDEVWNDFLKETGGSKDGFPSLNQREPTLGEITLEEFLARAGVDKEDIKPIENSCNVGVYGGCDSINGNNDAFSFGLQPIADEIMGKNKGVSLNNNVLTSSQQQLNQQSQQPLLQPLFPKQRHMISTTQVVGNNGIMRMTGLHGVSTMAEGSKNNLDTSSLSSSPCAFNQGGGRGRRSSNTIEKQVERRHKRMIKNRESATRSRARKQAYTLELEEEVAKLKEVNKELQKSQAELMEVQKNQILESLKRPRGDDRSCLRRTMTGPW